MRWSLACILLFACEPQREAVEPAPEPPARAVAATAEEQTPEPAAPEPEPSSHLRDVDCVYLQPLGDVSAETTQIVRDALAETYGVELRVGPHRELPEDAYYTPRKRYRAEILLDHLDGWLPDDCDRIVGITHEDISTTKEPHQDWGILGLGNMPGKSCVVSSFRVRKKLRAVPADERLARVAIHELGHTLGLDHCPNVGCLMEDARGTVETIDGETHLCSTCLKQIGWRGDPPPPRPGG